VWTVSSSVFSVKERLLSIEVFLSLQEYYTGKHAQEFNSSALKRHSKYAENKARNKDLFMRCHGKDIKHQLVYFVEKGEEESAILPS